MSLDASHPEDGDIYWSKCITEWVIVLSGLHMEQQVGYCIHCDVGYYCEGISSNKDRRNCVFRTSSLSFCVYYMCAYSVPVRSEFYFSMLTGDQLWNERQVGDLRGGPAKLKDYDERDEIGQACQLRSEGVTAQTLVKDEGKG